MRLTALSTIVLLALTGIASAQTAGRGDLLPHVKPTWRAGSDLAAADVRAPLATAAEEKAFADTYGAIVAEAQKGTAEDAQAAITLLSRRALGENRGGLLRLMRLASLKLATDGNLPESALLTHAANAVDALAEPSVACLEKRGSILASGSDKWAAKHSHFSPKAVAENYFQLAELQARAGNAAAAIDTLAQGEEWAQRDSAFAASIASKVARFRAQLEAHVQIDKDLTAKPDDPAANTAKGLLYLVRNGDARAAAPYLAQSEKPQLKRVGEILGGGVDTAIRLALAAALADCLPLTSDREQLAFAHLMQEQLEAVNRDAKATPAAKARAELLAIKADNVLKKAGESGVASGKPVTFFGLEATGKRIVFILDHSGSMLDNFDFLRQHAIATINALEKEQFFGVIWVSESASGAKVLSPATPEAKQEFAKIAREYKAQGQNDDVLPPFAEAFTAAFKLRPDTIFFLTDGHFHNGLPEVVQKLNGGKRVAIHTLAFVNKEPSYEQQLKKMAEANGGKYHFVSERDLGRRR